MERKKENGEMHQRRGNGKPIYFIFFFVFFGYKDFNVTDGLILALPEFEFESR